ncbi:MAG: 4a-hydroxytetrahydrobiopterin dehydratase [Nitriliruptorales bacterium]|nr:4a-hydroxytetrahydrobiopterin dehydratase [Nitriliruptorales bacterium]
MDRLTDEQVAAGLEALDNWQRDGDAITRTFRADSYPDAVAFVVRMAFAAEEANHHPDITWSWVNVTVSLSTHDAGGITQNDLDLAATIDRLA